MWEDFRTQANKKNRLSGSTSTYLTLILLTLQLFVQNEYVLLFKHFIKSFLLADSHVYFSEQDDMYIYS